MSKRNLILSSVFVGALLLFVGVLFLMPPLGTPRAWAAATSKSVQTMSMTPITPTYNTITSTDGIVFSNNGATYLHFKSTSEGTEYLTVTTPFEAGGLALADLTFTITAGGERVVGPLPPTWFNETSGTNRGKTTIQSSNLASVTVAIIAWE